MCSPITPRSRPPLIMVIFKLHRIESEVSDDLTAIL
jgi:hypothetical protein